jgi:hypothetical protein
MVYFDTSNFDAIAKKLAEFSAQLASSGVHTLSHSSCILRLASTLEHSAEPRVLLYAQGQLTERETELLGSLIRTLKDTSRYHATSFTSDELRVVKKLLTWPAPNRFPGTPFPI